MITKIEVLTGVLVILVLFWWALFPFIAMGWSKEPSTKNTKKGDYFMLAQIALWFLVLGAFIIWFLLWFIRLPSGF